LRRWPDHGREAELYCARRAPPRPGGVPRAATGGEKAQKILSNISKKYCNILKNVDKTNTSKKVVTFLKNVGTFFN
jgi:hypothetical protein